MPLASITFEYINENTNIHYIGQNYPQRLVLAVHPCLHKRYRQRATKTRIYKAFRQIHGKAILLQGSGKSFGNFIMPHDQEHAVNVADKEHQVCPALRCSYPKREQLTLTARERHKPSIRHLVLIQLCKYRREPTVCRRGK